jgi:hypothetical protein
MERRRQQLIFVLLLVTKIASNKTLTCITQHKGNLYSQQPVNLQQM